MKNYIIFILITVIVAGVLYFNYTNQNKPDPDSKSDLKPFFEVKGVSIKKSNTEEYKPLFTEYYDTNDFVTMSEGAEFTYTFAITQGARTITKLYVKRTSPDQQNTETSELTIGSIGLEDDMDYELMFGAQDGENILGTHTFTLTYETPITTGTGAASETVVTEEVLSVGLKEATGGSIALDVTDVLSKEATVTTDIAKKYVYIKDIDGKNIFGEDAVYLSPVEKSDGRGFKLQGLEPPLDVLAKPFYLINCKNSSCGSSDYNGYYLMTTKNIKGGKIPEDTDYLTKDKSLVKFAEGDFKDKLFKIEAFSLNFQLGPKPSA